MEQKLLFNLEEVEKQPYERKRKETCKSCINFYQHYYGKMFYCGVKSQKGTAYGNKKIKARDEACNLYKNKKCK